MSDNRIIQIGGLVPPRENRKNPSRGRVFSGNGISPCLDTCQGGGLQPYVVTENMNGTKIKLLGNIYSEKNGTGYAGNVFDSEGLSPTINTCTGGGRMPMTLEKMEDTNKTICLNPKDENGKQPSLNDRVYSVDGTSTACATTPFFQGSICDKYRIRKLTPKECFRLQGWSDEYFSRAELVNSNAQLYKQAGNGVTVDVIYNIAKKISEVNL